MNILKSLSKYLFSEERRKIVKSVKDNLESLKEEMDKIAPLPSTNKKVYTNKIHLNGNTMLVFDDGEMWQIEDPNKIVYNIISQDKSKEELKKLFVESEKNTKISPTDLHILSKDPNFTCLPLGVFMKDISWRLPDEIVADFVELYEKIQYYKINNDHKNLEIYKDQYNRLYIFTTKLAYSSVKEKENVLSFCVRNDVRLSKHGNIIGYRRVKHYKISQSRDLQFEYASEMYHKIKGWKKSPSNYTVYKDNGVYVTIENSKSHNYHEVIGNLHELYLKGNTGENVQLYSSSHQFGKYSFPIPSLYKMVGETPDANLSNCHSGGLHVASVSYNYSGYGDVPVVVLVNPAHSIYVPNNDSGKFRTSEMYIVGINPNDHGVHISDSFIEEADELYNSITIEQIKEILKTKKFETVKGGSENKPAVVLEDMSKVLDILANRTITI